MVTTLYRNGRQDQRDKKLNATYIAILNGGFIYWADSFVVSLGQYHIRGILMERVLAIDDINVVSNYIVANQILNGFMLLLIIWQLNHDNN